MPQSLSKIYLHIIFSTQDRKPLLFQELQEELYSYLASACNAHGSYASKIGGTTNHVHVATTLPRTISVSKLLEEIKKSSSKWIKTKDTRLNTFSWQKGYGAFSVGQSQLKSLIDYIRHQETHHRRKSFQEEYLEFLKRYKIEYDERYVWD
jgi:REP element-mobilizing transposase RayT